MSKNRFLVAVVVCVSTLAATAGELAMSVDTLLSRVATCNSDVKAAQARLQADLEGIGVARNARLPEIDAELQLSYIGDGTILDRDFDSAMRDRLPHFGNSLNVSLYQPIYQGGAINAGIDMASLKAKLAAIGVEQQLDATSIEALQSYFSLMQMYNLVGVYKENIALSEKLVENMTDRYNQGVALKNDITRYELRLSSLRFDLQTVENRISVLNKNLTSLLALHPDTRIVPTEEAFLSQLPPAEDYWQATMLRESTDLKAVDVSRDMAETSLRLVNAERRPSIGIFAFDNLAGPVTFEIPAINKNYNAWALGVSLKYSLSSLYKTPKSARQKRLEIARIDESRTALEEALGRRVHECYTALIEARQMLSTEEVNVKLANENYEIVETRFNADMALLTDMLDASTAKLDSEVRLVNARISLVLAYYQLKYVTGTLNNQPP